MVHWIVQTGSRSHISKLTTLLPLLQNYVDEGNSRGSTIFGLVNLVEEDLPETERIGMLVRFLYHNLEWIRSWASNKLLKLLFSAVTPELLEYVDPFYSLEEQEDASLIPPSYSFFQSNDFHTIEMIFLRAEKLESDIRQSALDQMIKLTAGLYIFN